MLAATKPYTISTHPSDTMQHVVYIGQSSRYRHGFCLSHALLIIVVTYYCTKNTRPMEPLIHACIINIVIMHYATYVAT